MPNRLLNDKLNAETARIAWSELEVHFARGAAVYIAPSLDLIAAARLIADDDSTTVGKLMQQGLISLVSEQQATQFSRDRQEMWALVIAPWVLVQPVQTA
ncbi:MAG: DUF2288 domain-containing protein [Neisseria sp.]|nr:DUF2288 domain-containing protein [Neisseria sp.]